MRITRVCTYMIKQTGSPLADDLVDTVAKAHDRNLHIISATVQYYLATA